MTPSPETMVAPIAVRPAHEDDVPWLLEQLRAFSDFFGTARALFPEDETHAAETIGALIAHHPFILAVSGEERVGFIAGTLSGHPFNPLIRVLAEVFWWVVPEHRGTRAGALLLQAFEAIGRERADWIVMTLEAQSPINPATLTRRGYRLHERSYLLEV